MTYERLECSDSTFLSNNHTLSHYSNRSISLEFWSSYSSEHLTVSQKFFSEKYVCDDDDDDDDDDDELFLSLTDERRLRLISKRNHCQRSSPLPISDTLV